MTVSWMRSIPAGGKWSGTIGRGQLLRFTAYRAGANVSVLLYNEKDLSERYNMPDTLKAQHTAHLTRGNVLMSDNGRVMASIVEDSVGWHDTISGYTRRADTDRKYGKTNYQVFRNDWLKSGYENFAVELMRNGLGVRDLVPPINFFSKVSCDEQGTMSFASGHSLAGSTVTLRCEMDVLLILSNTPHPLDPSPIYPSSIVDLEALATEPVSADDECVTRRAENQRAFENTWEYYALLGQ